MNLLKGLWVRVRALLFRKKVEQELDDEIRFHLDMETEQLIHRSLPPDEARRKALLEFGGEKEECLLKEYVLQDGDVILFRAAP